MRFYIILAALIFYLLAPLVYYEYAMTINTLLAGYFLIELIHYLSRRIAIFPLLIFAAFLMWVFVPTLVFYLQDIQWYEGYTVFPITLEEYLSVAFPGTMALALGASVPLAYVDRPHKPYLDRVEKYLDEYPKLGPTLLLIGIACDILLPVMPSMLAFPVKLGSNLVYIGGLYVYFSHSTPQRNAFLLLALAAALGHALLQAMFGMLVKWGVFILMYFMIKRQTLLSTKLIFTGIGLAFLLLIQSIKYDYRLLNSGWFQERPELAGESSLAIFTKLVDERIDNPDLLFGKPMLTNALDRLNQGYLTSLAIAYTPLHEPYAYGETIFKAGLASFIPRFMWPKKPETGGRVNMIRFTGYDPGEITSMNIAPLGDAYVNFGPWGGALFLFFYALMFKAALNYLFKLTDTYPTLILWAPLIFFETIHVESDVVAVFNHFVKSILFVAVVYYFAKEVLKKEI